ncbi:TonB-dependent receptor [Oceanicoccus sp. KOV_DT_Chl]|uniref:TonB-dependent receptor n=1 Tax=Oceanicoccus sp. KOV_DT_Chl TaxID=1904639 RepID=UPI000C7C0636|nr:TonB-dependent receptor [Oceanicoccus sp. KOV_DT_Chl]
MLIKDTVGSFVCSLTITGLLISASSSAQMLEEITVTAQKRVEGLGDVPLSIQVVAGDTLDRSNIFSFKDLVDRLPNVTFGESPGQKTISIRGVGTGTFNAAAEQSVGMYVDGIYASRGLQFSSPFLDIERVEVLKGPQGVLQGKNSIAGAIVVSTRRPTMEKEGYISGSYEVENDGYNIEGAISGPLTDTLALRLTAQQNFAGGWIDTNSRLAADGTTVLRGQNDQNENTFSLLRLSSLWSPSENLELFLKLETGKSKNEGVAYGGYAIQPGAVVGGVTNDQTLIIDDYLSRDPNYGTITDGISSTGFRTEYNEAINLFEANNKGLYQEIENDSATFQFDWNTGELGTLTGITGYSSYDEESYITNTMAPLDWYHTYGEKGNGGEEFEQLTQEIRLTSSGGATIDYIVGVFYMDRTIKQDGAGTNVNLSNGGFGLPPFSDLSGIRHFNEDTEAWSVFGQITWNISDALRLNLGARYTDETKEVDHTLATQFLVVVPPLNQLVLDQFAIEPFITEDLSTDEVSDSNTDPSVSVQWDMTDDLMLYTSYTQATKAGGFNSSTFSPENASFEPEQATAVEVGVKGLFIDGRLGVNASLFHTEYDDLQVAALDTNTTSFFFKNAAKATSEGVEADFRFAATEGLELGGAMAYLDVSYDDFPGATCSTGTSQEADCDPVSLTRNAKGDTLRAAPEWTGTLYADYRWLLDSGMEVALRGDVIYSDDYYIDTPNDPYLQQDSFTKLDLLASITSASGDWTLSIIGKNVTDKTTVSFGGGTPQREGAYWSNVDSPRLVYVKADYRF